MPTKMTKVTRLTAVAALFVPILLPPAANAQRANRTAQDEDWADSPYNPNAPPGAAVRAMSRRNQAAPGVTNELAPDNKATATGGPSGGVPGFDSH